MARGCGAKHICASKCRKHLSPGDILEVPMFQNVTRLWRKAHLQVKMHKTPHGRSHFGSCDVQKLHAAVAKSAFASENVQNTAWAEPFWKLRCSKTPRGCATSTFASQNAQNTTFPEPFWKLRCSKMARRCGAKHICKSKCGKTDGYGPLFGGLMSKNGTPLWREAHLQVKMLKTHAFSSILGRFALTSSLTN